MTFCNASGHVIIVPASASSINPRNFWFWFGGIWLGWGAVPPAVAFFAWNELTLGRLAPDSVCMVLVKSWGDGLTAGIEPSR
jgi:hypothetical protein